MSKQIHGKLNQLLTHWKNETIITTYWLLQHGYSNQLIKKYGDNGWITKVGQGAYAKLNEKPHWTGGLYALQKELGFSIHVGGLTALEYYGLAQNIVFQKSLQKVYLFNIAKNKRPLPKWFKQAFPEIMYAQYNLINKSLGIENHTLENIDLLVASPELAILEILALTPHAFSYEHVNHLIENCQLLRPFVLQELLEECTSIKVKRLFLYLADKYQLPCFNKLALERIDLGKGKRVIGEGGVYSVKYLLSVPTFESEYEAAIGKI